MKPLPSFSRLSPARARVFACGLALSLVFAARVTAQTVTTLTYDTHYVATGMNQFSSGSATIIDYEHNFGTSWSTSYDFGGFTTGFFGDEWGAGGTASTSGSIGFGVLFKVNGGSINVDLPNKIGITVPTDPNNTTPSLGFTQDRSAIGNRDFFTTQFPNIELGLDTYLHVNAQVSGRIAYGVGSSSGTVTIQDLARLYGLASANPILATTDPFNNDLNLISYNVNGNHTLTVLGLSKDLGNGFTKQLNSKDVAYVPDSPIFPTQVEFGSVTINPINNSLNASSGSSLTKTVSQTTLVGAGVDILGLASLAMGLPINPFEPKITIPGTPITLDATLLDVNAGINLGLKQSLTLLPHTYVGLTSNYPVSYAWTDAGGAHTATNVTNFQYLLPDDGSASTLQITSRPTQSDWQLYSSIFIDPQLLNQLYLTISGNINFQALAASIGAYGASAGFGPLVNENYNLNLSSLDILLLSTLVDLQSSELSRVYRNPKPLFGAGVQQNLTVDAGDVVQLFDQSGNFNTTAIDGTLVLRNALFNADNAITVKGTLDLDGRTNAFYTPTLNVAAAGHVVVDADSEIFVGSTGTPGFVAADGTIATGTYQIGGTIHYTGADITAIASGVHLELLPSGYLSDLGWRFDNNNGASHDGLRALSSNAGYLLIAGQDLALTGALTNSGTLIVTNGHDLSTAGNFTNANGAAVTVGDASIFTIGGTWTNLASNTLSNLNLTLGGTTSGGTLRYVGSTPTTLAATTSLTLSGSRPVLYDNNNTEVANGYLLGGAGGLTDAVAGLATNAGTLRLQHGATQSLAGSLASSGSLQVADAGTALTINGSLTNTGTVSLTGGGGITATGTLGNLSGGTLAGGTWTLGGILNYTGSDITAIAAGTAVTFDGSGNGLRNAGSNAFDHFATLNGSLTLANGAALVTDGTLALNGALTLGSGASVSAAGVSAIGSGLDLTGAALTLTGGLPGGATLSFAGPLTLGGTLTYGGPLVTGLGAGTRLNARSGGSLVNGGNGLRSLANVAGTLDLASGGSVVTDAALTIAPGGTLNLGADGTLQVTGPAFTLASGATLTLGGELILGGAGSQTSWTLADGFNFSSGTLSLGVTAYGHDSAGLYLTTTGSGALTIGSGQSWTNGASILGAGAITGGSFTNRGTLMAGGGTLAIGGLDGTLVNTGLLGSTGTPAHPGSLTLNAVTLQNHGSVNGTETSGRIEARSNVAFGNSTVAGGTILVTASGTLESTTSTFGVDQFNVEGAFVVHAGGTTSVTGPAYFSPSSTLTLETGATPAVLAFGTGSSFVNQGLITLGGGTAITGLTIVNQGRVELGAGQTTNLNNIDNTASGLIDLLNGSTLNLATSSFANAGFIHLSGEDPATLAHSASTFLVNQDLTLTGGGTIQLGGFISSTATTASNGAAINVADVTWANAGSGTVLSTNGDHVLTLQSQKLVGQGNFGAGTLAIDNQAGGTISTYGSGSVLTIQTNSGGFRNRGTLEVGTGATLAFTGGPFLSLANGALTEGTYRVGGTLKIPGLGASFDTGVAITFDGASPAIVNENDQAVALHNILASGSFTRVNGTTTFATTAGSTFTNTGLLSAGSVGDNAVTTGTVAITGGYFTNFANQALTGGRYEVAGVLQFDNADIVTNAADLTLRASGQVQDQSGQNALAHLATNTGTFSLRTRANFTVGAGVATFNQRGAINVAAGSTLNFGPAAINNVAADHPSYWIGGTVTGGTGFTTDGTTVTLYGPAATLAVGGATTPISANAGSLTFAGGFGATYTSPLYADRLINHGTWQIGSSHAIGADGSTLRSAGSVTFTGSPGTPVIWENTGTIRYYGGATDDGSSGAFTLSNLLIDGGLTSAGTFDASGTVRINSGGALQLNGTLADSEGALTFSGGAVNVVGGLDLTHSLYLTNATFGFTTNGGRPIHLDGITFSASGLDLGTNNTADISLRNDARLVNATTNESALVHLVTNDGTIELVNTHPEFFGSFGNYGTLRTSNTVGGSTWMQFSGDLYNHGDIVGNMVVTGDLHNTQGATFTGSFSATNDFFNDSGATFSGTGSVGRDFNNDGTLEAGFNAFTVGRYVNNSGDLTIRSSSFVDAGSHPADIANFGTLRLNTGNYANHLLGSGDVHVLAAASVTPAVANPNLTARWYVDDGGELIVGADANLGAAPSASVNPWVTLGHDAALTFAGPLATHRSVLAGAGATINGTTSDAAIPAGVSGLGDLTLVGHVTTQVSLPNSAALHLAGALTMTQAEFFGQAVDGSGSIANPSGYTLSFGGGASFNGSISNSTGGLLLMGGPVFTPDVTNDGSMIFNGGGSLTYEGNLSGAGTFRLTNGTALNLTRFNGFSGTTTIDSGSSLTLSDFGTLGGTIVDNGNLTFAYDGDTFTLPGSISGTGGVTQGGHNSFLTLPDLGLAGGLDIAYADSYLMIGTGGALNGTISAPIVDNGSLWFNHAGSINLTGALSGTGGLEHIGSGTLILTGAKTFSGKTYVGADFVPNTGTSAGGGTLAITGDSSLGTAPASFVADQLLLNDGSTLNVLANTTLAATRGLTTGGTVTITGASLDVGNNLGGAGAINYTGVGTLSVLMGDHYGPHDFSVGNFGTLVLDNAGHDVVFTNALGGTVNSTVRFAGAGSTMLRNTGAMLGLTEIAAGSTVRLGAGAAQGSLGAFTNVLGTLELGRGDTTTVSGLYGDGTIIKDFAGTTTIAQSPNGFTAYRGSLILRGGVLQLATYSDLGLAPDDYRAGGLTFDGGTLRFTSTYGGGVGGNQGVTVTANGGTIDLPDANATFGIGSTISGPGLLTKTGAGTLALAGSGTISSSFKVVDGWLTEVSTADTTYTGNITDNVNSLFISNPASRGAFWVDHTLFHGNVTLLGTNTYTGGTRVSGGVDLILGNGGTAGSILGDVETYLQSYLSYDHSGDFVLPNNVTGAGGLKQAGPGILTIDSAQTFTGALIANNGTIRLTDTGSVAGDIVTNANLLLDKSGTETIANVISGTGKVTKDDTLNLTVDHGTVTLDGANTYSGLTEVKAGTLIITADNPGNGGASVANGATLRFTGSGGLGGTITLGATGQLQLAYASDHTLAASFAGAGSIAKTGAGIATLTAAPSFSGQIGIAAGALEFSSDSDGEISGQIQGTGNLVKSGQGTLVLSAQNSFSGTTTINGGTLQLGSGGTSGRLFGPLVLNGGGTLAFDRGDQVLYADPISGQGAVAQRGGGTLVLVNDNTYTGGTTIAAGSALQVGNDGTTGSLGGDVVNHGTLIFNRHDAYTFAGNTSGSGVLEQAGYGLLTLTGQHTATGGAIIDAGSNLALGMTATLTGPVVNSGTLTILTDPNDGFGRDLPVSVSGTGGLTVDGGGTLRLVGDLTYTGQTTIANGSTLKLFNDQTSTLTNVLSGSGNFIKLGTGTLILTADSSLSGSVTVGQGTLQLGNGGSTGSIGGSISSGNIDLQGGTLAIDHADAITMPNAISGQGGIAQLGSGRLTLVNDNTFTGDVYVGPGAELQLGLGGATGSVVGHLAVDGTLISTRAGSWAINLGLTGAGTLSKPYQGNPADTIDIAGGTGYPVDFSGNISYVGGTVRVFSGGTLGSFAADNLQVFGGSDITLVGNTGFIHTVDNGNITLGNGGTTGSLGGDITGSGTLGFNRSDTFTYDGSFSGSAIHQLGPGTTIFTNGSHLFSGDVRIDAGTLALGTLVDGAVVLNGGTLRLDYGILGANASISGTGNVVTAASGITALPANTNFTGQTRIAGGTLQIAPAGGTTTLNGLVTGAGALHVTSAGTLVLAGGGSYSGATTLDFDVAAQAAPTMIVGGGLASSVSGYGTLEFDNAATATDTGGISGALDFIKDGSGRLVLAGQATHTGATHLNGGTLQLGAQNALSAESSVVVANVAGVLLDLDGYDTTVLSLNGGGAAGGNIDLGAGHLTISPHTSYGGQLDSRFDGNITGTGGLVVDGSGGTLTLTGQNTYTGGTKLTGGSLIVANSSALGTGAVLLDGGSGYPTLSLQSNLSFGASRPIQLAHGGGFLSVASNAAATIDVPITGSGDFIKSGSGSVVLNAAPANAGTVSSAGSIYVNQGSVVLGGPSVLTSSQVVVNGGYLDLNGQNWSTALTVNQGGIANSGAAASTFSGTASTGGYLSLKSTGGDLRFTGTIGNSGALSSAMNVYGEGTGRVSLAAAPAASVNTLTANGGTLAIESASSLTALTSLQAYQTGRIELSGGNASLTLSNLTLDGQNAAGDTAGLFNAAVGTTVTLNVAAGPNYPNVHFDGFNAAGSTLLVGGAGNLALNGPADGNSDLAKVGAGTVTFTGDYSSWSGKVDVRAGTLAADSGFFSGHGLNLHAGASIDVVGGGGSISLESLSGDGALALGSSSLSVNDASYTGAISTTGTLFKDGSGTATLGAVTAAAFVNNAGTSHITGSLGTGSVTVHGGDAYLDGSVAPGTLLKVDATDLYNTGGTLHVGVGQVTSGGTTFNADLETNGYVEVMGMTQDLTANAGTIKLLAGGAQLYGSNNVTGAMTANSGTMTAENGANFSVGSGFANGGTITVSGDNSGFSAGVGGSATMSNTGVIHVSGNLATLRVGSGGSATTFTQTAGSLTVDPGASLAVRNLNVSGGVVRLDGDGGRANVNLTGGMFKGSGQLTRGNLVLTGGTFSPGDSPGTFTVAQGNATFGPGGTFVFEINDAAGIAGTNWDLLSVTKFDPLTAGGQLNISATAGNPFHLSVVSLTAGNLPGALANFDPGQSTYFTFARADDGILGFSAAAFTVDTTGLANSFGGSWSVAEAGNSLNLVYSVSAVPEPATYAALAGLAALGWAAWWRRRRGSSGWR
ncbi:MAG TPA: autotransporter-associated beta strand repeat-containing protein [Lacunisphaera sp.]|nr:autotransporter-associated beta strand repeat-containing protein [Lacunisphaera sp.]